MEHAGNQLRKAIKEKGLTQEKAAELLGITRQTIGQWLKRSVFDANTLQELDIKLGIKIDGEQKPENISFPKEVFDKISMLIDTVCSQQDTIAEQHRTIDRLLEKSGVVQQVDTAGCADVG